LLIHNPGKPHTTSDSNTRYVLKKLKIFKGGRVPLKRKESMFSYMELHGIFMELPLSEVLIIIWGYGN